VKKKWKISGPLRGGDFFLIHTVGYLGNGFRGLLVVTTSFDIFVILLLLLQWSSTAHPFLVQPHVPRSFSHMNFALNKSYITDFIRNSVVYRTVPICERVFFVLSSQKGAVVSVSININLYVVFWIVGGCNLPTVSKHWRMSIVQIRLQFHLLVQKHIQTNLSTVKWTQWHEVKYGRLNLQMQLKNVNNTSSRSVNIRLSHRT